MPLPWPGPTGLPQAAGRGLRASPVRRFAGLATSIGIVGLSVHAQARAQDVAEGRSQWLVPGLETRLSYVDSAQRPGSVSGSGFTADLGAGLEYGSRSGRMQGRFDYRLDAIRRSRSTQASEWQNALDASFKAEAIENLAFVEANAGIGQQAVSAYGRQSADPIDANPNRAEVARASVSPFLHQALGTVATLDARLTAAGTSGRHEPAADSSVVSGLVALDSDHRGALFGWNLQASRQRSNFRIGRATHEQRWLAQLSFRPDPELMLAARGGRETTNVGSLSDVTFNNWGGELRWTPTERTLASLVADRRYFGQSRQVLLEHRMPSSSIRYTSIRDATGSADANGVGQAATLYQIYFNQFASVQPDPVLREQLVLDYLRALGRDPSSTVAGGALYGGVTLQRRDDLALSYAGRRTTLSLQAFASTSSLLDDPQHLLDTGPVRQRGCTVAANYRLTPTATASLTGSQLKTLAAPAQPGNDLQSVSLGWADQLALRTRAALSLRYSRFSSLSEPYRETSLTASLSQRF
jgi:uncharacterized protein (PEP-CTERM system associated)